MANNNDFPAVIDAPPGAHDGSIYVVTMNDNGTPMLFLVGTRDLKVNEVSVMRNGVSVPFQIGTAVEGSIVLEGKVEYLC